MSNAFAWSLAWPKDLFHFLLIVSFHNSLRKEELNIVKILPLANRIVFLISQILVKLSCNFLRVIAHELKVQHWVFDEFHILYSRCEEPPLLEVVELIAMAVLRIAHEKTLLHLVVKLRPSLRRDERVADGAPDDRLRDVRLDLVPHREGSTTFLEGRGWKDVFQRGGVLDRLVPEVLREFGVGEEGFGPIHKRLVLAFGYAGLTMRVGYSVIVFDTCGSTKLSPDMALVLASLVTEDLLDLSPRLELDLVSPFLELRKEVALLLEENDGGVASLRIDERRKVLRACLTRHLHWSAQIRVDDVKPVFRLDLS